MGRIVVVVVGVVAALLAYGYGNLVALLGTFGFGTFAAALAPTLAVGLNWSGVTRRAVIASISTGTVLNLGLEAWTRIADRALPHGALPSAVALAASFSVLFALSSWGEPARKG